MVTSVTLCKCCASDWLLFCFKLKINTVICRDGELETFELSEDFVNPGQPRTRPQDFELLKLLGKGGYGKVVPNG